MIPETKYKNLVLYELFSPKGHNNLYKKNCLAQLSICYKEVEMLFDSLQCNTEGNIIKLRLIMQSSKM